MITRKRGAIYYSRLRVPSDLRPILRKREITKSLKTDSYREASLHGCMQEGRVARLFSFVREGLLLMTPQEIRKLARQYMKDFLEFAEESVVEAIEGAKKGNDFLVAGFENGYPELAQQCQDDLRANDLKNIKKEAGDYLKENGLSMKKSSTEFKSLCRVLLMTKREAAIIMMRRWDGDYSDQYAEDGGSGHGSDEADSIERIPLSQPLNYILKKTNCGS